MKAYYLVFVLTLLLSVVLQARTDKQWRWKLFFTFLPLFIFGAIRVDFGNDYSTYEAVYESVHSSNMFVSDEDAHAEIGYQLLNWIMPSFRSLLVLNSFLLSFSLGVFCYQNVPRNYLWLAVILIFLNPEKNIYGTLVALRSGLCVSAFFLSFVLVQRRKWALFFIISSLLSFIHTSALLFMPIAYFVGSNHGFRLKEVWLWGGVIALLLFMSMTQLFDMISVFIGEASVFERYEEVLSATQSHRGVLLTLTSLVFVALFIIYFRQRGKYLSSNENSLLRVGLLFTVTAFLGSLAMRASYFYDVFFIVAVVKVFSDKLADEALRYSLLILALLTSYYSMFIVWMGSEWWNHAVYHSLLGSW